MSSQQPNPPPDLPSVTYTKQQTDRLFNLTLQTAQEQLRLVQLRKSLIRQEHAEQKARLDAEREVRKECMEWESDAKIAQTKDTSAKEQEIMLRESGVKRQAVAEESRARVRNGERVCEREVEEKKRFGQMAVDINVEESVVRSLCAENESCEKMGREVKYMDVLDVARERIRDRKLT